MQVEILAFGAHPDDVELGCCGTLLAESSRGKRFGLVDLTEGELGTRGTAASRREEAELAASLMGASFRENLGLRDGFFEADEASILKVVAVLRKYRPRIVICNAPSDRHPDHSKGSDLVSKACFYSGLSKIQTELEGNYQPSWRPEFLLHYIQFWSLKPDLIVDISDYMDRKIECVQAFKSQFYQANSQEPATVISSKHFLENIRERASDLGRLTGCRYGEGFLFQRTPGIRKLDDLF